MNDIDKVRLHNRVMKLVTLPTRPEFLPFKEAREFARSLKLKGKKDWFAYCKSGKKPFDIPSRPDRVYEDFVGYGDWVGTGNTWKKEFLPFNKARTFARSLKLKNQKEWFAYCKSGKKPKDIPSSPNNFYDNFVGYGNWLGTGNIALQNRKFLPFNKARTFVRSLKLKSFREWQAYSASGNRPKDIPSHPDQVYEEFVGYGNWLGTGNKRGGQP